MVGTHDGLLLLFVVDEVVGEEILLSFPPSIFLLRLLLPVDDILQVGRDAKNVKLIERLLRNLMMNSIFQIVSDGSVVRFTLLLASEGGTSLAII